MSHMLSLQMMEILHKTRCHVGPNRSHFNRRKFLAKPNRMQHGSISRSRLNRCSLISKGMRKSHKPSKCKWALSHKYSRQCRHHMFADAVLIALRNCRATAGNADAHSPSVAHLHFDNISLKRELSPLSSPLRYCRADVKGDVAAVTRLRRPGYPTP